VPFDVAAQAAPSSRRSEACRHVRAPRAPRRFTSDPDCVAAAEGGAALATRGGMDLLGLGRLPGDVEVRAGRATVHFPITSTLLVATLAALVLAVLRTA